LARHMPAASASEVLVEVDVHIQDRQAASELAKRLGLIPVPGPDTLSIYAGDRSDWRCRVRVYTTGPAGPCPEVAAGGPLHLRLVRCGSSGEAGSRMAVSVQAGAAS
jgi:hypothetical protein